MKKIILADPQDITRAGMAWVCDNMEGVTTANALDKGSMLELLKSGPEAVVVLDYTLFDINDVEELAVYNMRFPNVHWIMFSDDLTTDLARRVIAQGSHFSILLKDSLLAEIRECLMFAICGKRYICQHMAELLLVPPAPSESFEEVKLTKTETEILVDIANGMTTKEIAEKRFSSFHTVNTHRKNIFRKLSVNNVHEATKYALKAGLVDSAEYYI